MSEIKSVKLASVLDRCPFCDGHGKSYQQMSKNSAFRMAKCRRCNGTGSCYRRADYRRGEEK